MKEIMNYLQIRYVKLHFSIQFLREGRIPYYKSSALRGGMGHALLLTNCIRDGKCQKCDFSEDCLVRRLMYPEMRIRPAFMQTQDNEGFIIECEDYNEQVEKGDIVNFNLILFGRAIAYFTQYLQAFYNLGRMGLGKEHIPFHILLVTNTTGDTLVREMNIYKENYRISTIEEYVKYRLSSNEMKNYRDSESIYRLLFHSPLSIKHGGQMQSYFSPEAILASVERRLYILNCFEGRKDNDDYVRVQTIDHTPVIQDEYVFRENVKRYSGTHRSKVTFSGIRGWCELAGLDEAAILLLLAGELTHIGKNTSFGFGRYTLIKT